MSLLVFLSAVEPVIKASGPSAAELIGLAIAVAVPIMTLMIYLDSKRKNKLDHIDGCIDGLRSEVNDTREDLAYIKGQLENVDPARHVGWRKGWRM